MDERLLKWIGAGLALGADVSAEVARQASLSGKTTEEVQVEAARLWSQAKTEVDELSRLGHGETA